MKTPLKFALLAVGLSALLTLPASAQQFKERTCDNISTGRDNTLRPDNRCLQTTPDRFKEQQARIFAFIRANPPAKTGVETYDGNNRDPFVRYEGADRRGNGYVVISGNKQIYIFGSATKAFGGSGGRTSAR